MKYRGNRDLASLEKFIAEKLGNEIPEEAAAKATESAEAKVEAGLYILSEASFPATVAKGDTFIKFYAPWWGLGPNSTPPYSPTTSPIPTSGAATVRSWPLLGRSWPRPSRRTSRSGAGGAYGRNKDDGIIFVPGQVKIAKVDCTQHQSVCQEYEIKGYPTLAYFRWQRAPAPPPAFAAALARDSELLLILSLLFCSVLLSLYYCYFGYSSSV